jgi:hypothetical protein
VAFAVSFAFNESIVKRTPGCLHNVTLFLLEAKKSKAEIQEIRGCIEENRN